MYKNISSVFLYQENRDKWLTEKKEIVSLILIYDTASTIDAVGELEETLKWRELSYLTSKTKTGSTIRIDWKESQPEQYAMFFKCTSDLVSAYIVSNDGNNHLELTDTEVSKKLQRLL